MILLRSNFYVILSHGNNKCIIRAHKNGPYIKTKLSLLSVAVWIEAGRRRHRVWQSALPKSWLLSNFVLPNILLLIWTICLNGLDKFLLDPKHHWIIFKNILFLNLHTVFHKYPRSLFFSVKTCMSKCVLVSLLLNTRLFFFFKKINIQLYLV